MPMEFFSSQFFSALFAIVVIDLVLAGDNAIVIGLAARSLPPHLQKKAVFWGAIGAVVVRAILTAGVVWLLKIPSFLLVVIGLLISIPIVMLGSTLILKAVERFPVIIVFGAAVLGWTAGKMISAEPMLATFFAEHHGWRLALYAFCIGIIVVLPLLHRLRGWLSAQWVSLGFLMLWLAVFDHLEEYTSRKYFPAGDAPIALDLIDLAMWLGWIPIVIVLNGALAAPSTKAAKSPS